MTKKRNPSIGAVVCVIALALGSIMLHGWAIQFYWNTFLVPAVMSVHVISIVHALGLSGLVNLMIYRKYKKEPQQSWDELQREVAVMVLTPLLALAFGFLYRHWM